MQNIVKQMLSDDVYQVIKDINTPDKVQEYIDQHIKYDPYREDRSVEEVVRDGKGECYNGALFGTACLLNAGYKSSIIELYARGGDEEHILCVYKQGDYYGCVAQSKFLGLKSRKPIYPTVRDLAASYIEYYFSYDGKYSLLSFTNLFPLAKYHGKWLTDGKVVVQMGKDLRNYKHLPFAKENDPYYYVTPERYWKEMLYIPEYMTVPKLYLDAKPAHVDLSKLSEIH